MEPYLKELGRRLDVWSNDLAVTLTETVEHIVVGQLPFSAAIELLAFLQSSTPMISLEDGSGSMIDTSEAAQEFAPFRATIGKPAAPEEAESFLTNTMFKQWLSRPTTKTLAWVAQLDRPLDTFALRLAPWGDQRPFVPIDVTANPRRFVRETGARRQVPERVGKWLLREGSTPTWDNAAVQTWTELARDNLTLALVNEVEDTSDAREALFRGPPVVRIKIEHDQSSASSTSEYFWKLQEASRWVFEHERDAETKHALITAELARTGVQDVTLPKLFHRGIAPAHEGARIAHQIGLQKLSTDTLKALSDLRKAIGEETAKLSDTTRQLAAAVAAALFAGIGLITARLTTSFSSVISAEAVVFLSFILSLYIALIIVSAWQFIRLQRDLRTQWRDRLYRFLPLAEYDAMVTRPAARAETAFKVASGISGVLTVLLVVAAVVSAAAPIKEQEKASSTHLPEARTPTPAKSTPPIRKNQ